MGLKHLALLAVAPLCLASPLSLVPRQAAAAPLPPWDAGGVPEFPIHASCNNSEVIQLQKHLKDMKMVANHAIDRILRYGNGSELFVKWFGASPTAQPIGWYERIARADRAGFQFRCDDPDGFCGPPEWSGYWRGIDVAPEDVAICPRAFELLPLEGLCTRGYTLANWDITLVMVTDLMHRLLHVPSVSELVVEHYGNGYIGSLDLAESNPEEAVINSDSLQYFALEAWAVDFSVPGIGCVGNETVARDLYESSMSMESASAAATATAASSTAGTQAPSTTTAASACHTHANGEVHCT